MAYDKDKIFPLILAEIEEGASLRSILRREDMPNQNTFFEWLHEDELKSKQYAKSCEVRSEAIFEEILLIADQEYGTYIDELGNVKIDSASVQKKRLQVDSRKWMLGKMNPKKYGDKLDVTSDGEKINQTPIFGDNPLDSNV